MGSFGGREGFKTSPTKGSIGPPPNEEEAAEADPMASAEDSAAAAPESAEASRELYVVVFS